MIYKYLARLRLKVYLSSTEVQHVIALKIALINRELTEIMESVWNIHQRKCPFLGKQQNQTKFLQLCQFLRQNNYKEENMTGWEKLKTQTRDITETSPHHVWYLKMVCSILAGAINSWESFAINLVPVVGFIILCYVAKSETQVRTSSFLGSHQSLV